MNSTTQTAPRTIMLRTAYGGKEAPGGVFDTWSRHYLKKCKKENAGKHPHRDALGGFDESVVEQLRQLDCAAVWLELSDGRRYRCDFGTFAAHSFKVNWRDGRFPPRHYLDAYHWEEA